MARIKELVQFPEGPLSRQFREVIKGANSVSVRPHRRDIADDGTAMDGAASEQLDGRYVSFESKGVGVAVEVLHKLARIPVGFWEVARTHAGGIIGFPNDQSINRAWTAEKVYFVPQTPRGTRHRCLIF